MIHFLPDASGSAAVLDGGEMLARVAGLRRALRLVDPFGGGPASDLDEDLAFASAGEGVRRCFDRRSEHSVAAAAAGLDAVVQQRSMGSEANQVSLEVLAQDIRGALADLSSLLRA